MSPEALKALIVAAILAACVAVGFGAGWGVNGWRLKTKIAETEAAQSKVDAKNATDALATLATDAKAIHEAAGTYAAIQDTLTPKIAALTREIKNAPRPLDPGCKPDAYRVRNLETAIDAANAAARPARQ